MQDGASRNKQTEGHSDGQKDRNRTELNRRRECKSSKETENILGWGFPGELKSRLSVIYFPRLYKMFYLFLLLLFAPHLISFFLLVSHLWQANWVSPASGWKVRKKDIRCIWQATRQSNTLLPPQAAPPILSRTKQMNYFLASSKFHKGSLCLPHRWAIGRTQRFVWRC